MVLAVGTRFIGQASSVTLQSSATSAASASVDAGSPVIAISFCAEAAMNRLEQVEQLRRLAAVRQRDDDVVGLDDAEIAVDRLRGMQEEGGRAGARQGRGNLAADDSGFPHAGEDHPALAVAEELHRLVEPLVEPLDQGEDAAASVSRTLRASARSAMEPGLACLAIASIAVSRRSSGSSASRRSAPARRLGARRPSWTRGTRRRPPATPAEPEHDLPARPAVTLSPPPGNGGCGHVEYHRHTLARIIGKARMSTTRL